MWANCSRAERCSFRGASSFARALRIRQSRNLWFAAIERPALLQWISPSVSSRINTMMIKCSTTWRSHCLVSAQSVSRPLLPLSVPSPREAVPLQKPSLNHGMIIRRVRISQVTLWCGKTHFSQWRRNGTDWLVHWGAFSEHQKSITAWKHCDVAV